MSYYDHVQSPSTMDSVMSTARRRPEALLLIAAGCALMMMPKRKSLGFDTDSLRSKARGTQAQMSDLANQAYERASSMVEPVRGYANRVGSYVSETSNAAVSQAGELAQQVQSKTLSNLEHYMREQPLAVGLISLAVGAALGAALPETEVENRTLGSQRDLLAKKAQDMAEDQIQQLKDAAGEFGQKVMSKSDGNTERSPS